MNTNEHALAQTRTKKGRSNFSLQVTKKLETNYQQQQYLSAEQRYELAVKLNLTDRQVGGTSLFAIYLDKWRYCQYQTISPSILQQEY